MAVRVWDFLAGLNGREGERLPRVIESLDLKYNALSNYTFTSREGRLHDVCVIGRHAIEYWVDSADQHVKVIDIHDADRWVDH